MTRRDTIIIAILVNAGLLMVLFATAMRNDKKTEKLKTSDIAKIEIKQKKNSNLSDLLDEPLGQDKSSAKFVDNYGSSSPEIVFSESYDEDELILSSVFEGDSKIEPVPVQEAREAFHAQKQTTFTVKKGDVLEKIARAHGTTVSAIMEINHLTSTQLKIGQILKVPENQVASTSHVPPPPSIAEEYYIVKEGDNPWMIATKNKVKWEDVLRLNNLDDQKARRLRPGDKLRLR